MTTALVEKELGRFLSSQEPEVLCLHGKWGVGKTFIWNALLHDAVAKKKVGLESYAYVSLFGITSLDRLKYAIVENTVDINDIGRDLKPKITRDSIKTRASQFLRQYGPAFLGAGGGEEFASLAERLAFLFVTKTLICIDDLERKSDSLAVKDVLGLVDQLREQRKCKIILILNDGALNGDDEKQFKVLSEKVIDESLDFAPTASDCARIALGRDDLPTKLLRGRVMPFTP